MENDNLSDNDERSYGTASTQAMTEPFIPQQRRSAVIHASVSSLSVGSSAASQQGSLRFHHSASVPDLAGQSSPDLNDSSQLDLNGKLSEETDVENQGTNLIKHAVQQIGINSFGVVGVEVLVFDDEEDHFVHVNGGTWVDPVFRHTLPPQSTAALDKLVNPSNPEYIVPTPQVPGAGLAGYFWFLGLESVKTNFDAGRPLLWRDIFAIVSDPFQVPDERMQVILDAGFGLAAGMPFDVFGQKGIVIYLARKDAKEPMLNERNNAIFLRVAAHHIGSTCAMISSQHNSMQAKNSTMMKTYRRIRAKMHCVCVWSSLRFSTAPKKEEVWEPRPKISRKTFHPKETDMWENISHSFRMTSQAVASNTQMFFEEVKKRLLHARKKMHGGNLKPPPAAPWTNTFWTFAGAFLTLLCVHALSDIIHRITSGRYNILLAPFGALLTLQFGLTASPPSQPRSIIYGQMTSLSVALISKVYLLDTFGMNKLFVAPFSASIAIASMSKLGFTHPPAAAAVIALFAQKDGFDIFTVFCLLAGNIVAVGCATLINNLCETRQYPMYWEFGIGRSLQWFWGHFGKKK